ncbi:MAG: hypothetical protein JW944_03910 [Deltaproteobacteria bacterium]|nr:hypothetical protein [Deltaproteobacteria bacterium]
MDILADIFGWYGASAILVAYGLSSFGMIKRGLWYQILNFTGAVGIAVVSLEKGAFPPALLNIVWALIAFIALLRTGRIKGDNKFV